MFLTSQSYDFYAIAHAGAIWRKITVQNFMKIKWTVFENFEIFIEMSGEKTIQLHK